MNITTLDEFIIKSQKSYSDSTGQLTRLLRDIGIAAKIVNREVNRAGLVNILGIAGQENASGENVQKLDIFANERMIECLTNGAEVCGIAFHDVNGNCVLDAGEETLGNIKILIQPGGKIISTDNTGAYSVFLEPGTYTFQQQAGNNWQGTCPLPAGSDHTITVNDIGNKYCGYDFGFQAACPYPDLAAPSGDRGGRSGLQSDRVAARPVPQGLSVENPRDP